MVLDRRRQRGNGILKRGIITLAALVVAAFVVAACGGVVQPGDEGGGSGQDGFRLADYIREHVENGDKLVIRVSYHNTSLGFANPIREGVEKAKRELGVDAELIGPANGSAQEQVSELQTLISQQKVDGLAVSSASNDALKPVIAQAYNAGIPIISFNTNNPGSKQMAFVGQDLVQSGRFEAEQLRKELGDRKGKVVVFSVDTGAGWSNDRFSGFEAGMEGAEGIQIEGPINSGNEPRQAFNAVQNTMTANPDAIAIASLDCCSVDAAAKWVQQNGKKGEIIVVGFDVLPQTADFIRNGVIQFTISQNPVEQGYQSVKILNDFLKKNKPLRDVNTGTKLVDKSNIDEVPLEG
ncbi:periplasmic binding protein/LacI transcriptional regulator [Rubrobacter xylanophilus DSM 9941]|uniref:Periplasmic binding protein/LacI transcriptional regulator n=1 Tax=Rubrobacter xylanophilus (strain DSM 9941 / JCM 11954 / NBRC 16129 / PRD-1) TaxID=266117 RepID=Q1AUT8_RUBXD|nr:substrate-binding domain-containing protein [Rubrobacter xylanophilus]ABG04840.1 periplasmic binding protein/LacI transcriptional regulator [Rubrobacter xylanophilus DSM 9941]